MRYHCNVDSWQIWNRLVHRRIAQNIQIIVLETFTAAMKSAVQILVIINAKIVVYNLLTYLAFVCRMKVDEGGCNKTEVRYFYNFEKNVCQMFLFSGSFCLYFNCRIEQIIM